MLINCTVCYVTQRKVRGEPTANLEPTTHSPCVRILNGLLKRPKAINVNIWLIGPIELSIQPIDTKRQSVKYRLFLSTLNGTGDVLSEEGLSTEVKYDLKVSLPGLWLLTVEC